MWGEARGPSGLGGGGGDEGEGGDAEDAVVELDAGRVLRHVPQRGAEAQQVLGDPAVSELGEAVVDQASAQARHERS